MTTWYQRIAKGMTEPEWTSEPPCHWSGVNERLLASIESDVMPREEYFDRSSGCQASYHPSYKYGRK